MLFNPCIWRQKNIWTIHQGSTHSYLTVTCHVITENFELHEFVLSNEEMQVSHTAENLLEKLEDKIISWEFTENITFVTDNASEIKRQLYILRNTHGALVGAIF